MTPLSGAGHPQAPQYYSVKNQTGPTQVFRNLSPQNIPLVHSSQQNPAQNFYTQTEPDDLNTQKKRQIPIPIRTFTKQRDRSQTSHTAHSLDQNSSKQQSQAHHQLWQQHQFQQFQQFIQQQQPIPLQHSS